MKTCDKSSGKQKTLYLEGGQQSQFPTIKVINCYNISLLDSSISLWPPLPEQLLFCHYGDYDEAISDLYMVK